MGVFKANLIL